MFQVMDKLGEVITENTLKGVFSPMLPPFVQTGPNERQYVYCSGSEQNRQEKHNGTIRLVAFVLH